MATIALPNSSLFEHYSQVKRASVLIVPPPATEETLFTSSTQSTLKKEHRRSIASTLNVSSPSSERRGEQRIKSLAQDVRYKVKGLFQPACHPLHPHESTYTIKEEEQQELIPFPSSGARYGTIEYKKHRLSRSLKKSKKTRMQKRTSRNIVQLRNGLKRVRLHIL
ncbi:hypothetical protein BT69DRAFT_1351161 [Atractiella rhizophila]|nr:hypothetical protein BT69DRAFT_1351161 [Atractiella rhizophila]